MTVSAFLIGAVSTSLYVGSLAVAATAARGWLLPEAHGSTARLVEIIFAVSAAVVISELLGTFGGLTRGPLVVAAVMVALVLVTTGRGRGRLPSRSLRGGRHVVIVSAAAAITVIVVQWGAWSIDGLRFGPLGVDTLRYHLPLAARMAHGARLTELQFLDQDLLITYDPLNSELLHADAIALFGRDILSPLINLVWVALGLLAGWVAGRRFNASLQTLLAVCVALSVPLLVSTNGGSANNDVAVVALLLASVVLLLDPAPETGHVVASGLAAGLAFGTKFDALVPVVALLILVPFTLGKVGRRRALGYWLGPAFASGAFCYIRNWAAVGSPAPELRLHLGALMLPQVNDPVRRLTSFTVAHYLTDGWFWRRFALPSLHDALGPLWWLLLAVSGLGIILGLWRGPRHIRLIAAIATAVAIAYLFTPYGAGGPAGDPWQFPEDLRFLLPAVALGLVAFSLSLGSSHRTRIASSISLVCLLAVNELAQTDLFSAWPNAHAALDAALVAVVIGILYATIVRLEHPRSRLLVGAVVLIAVIAAGYPYQRHYLSVRYSRDPLARWADALHDARIGEIGYPEAYPLYGSHLSNKVVYLERPTGRGDLLPARSCRAWAATLKLFAIHYVVVGTNTLIPPGTPQVAWTKQLAPTRQVLVYGGTTVLRLLGPLDPARCGRAYD